VGCGTVVAMTGVITQCCGAPVRLGYPEQTSLTVGVICSRCHREAGRPGIEDSPDVERFLDWYREMPTLTVRVVPR
jgi:hypothetical protein